MKSLIRIGVGPLSIVPLLVLSAQLSAGTVILEAKLDGSHEFPTNGSTGTGQATITLNDATGQVSLTGSYQGLSSDATAAHIHGLAAPGANAGVIIPLTASGGTAGTISGSGVLDAAKMQGMLDGLTYVNVHTTNLGGGEIRGQITKPPPVPVLTPWGILALVALLAGSAIGLLRRRIALN